MNVAFYTRAFDKAIDEIFDDWLGIGEEQAKTLRMGPMALQSMIHYVAELKLGEEFACDFQLLDADHKRIHFFATMIKLETGAEAATYESLSMNVDLVARRSAPYPAEAQARVDALKAAHAGLPIPERVGARIGIRRKA
ncbi:thioesterase family protein [Rhodobacteraceae bacterium NNCM2]|nr:thioesterase family protein [Coraliihabitans acroporae]